MSNTSDTSDSLNQSEPRTLYQAPEPQGPAEMGQVILKDGSTAYLRPAKAEDKDMLITFLESISKEAYIRRFFADTPYQAAAKRMLESEPTRMKLVLFVLTGDPERPSLMATGEYTREKEGSKEAEVAFLVADEHRGKGLGTLILERLALVAARHGIERFTAITMSRNREMINVFKSSGFEVRRRLEYGDVEIDFSIQPSRESVARAEAREQVATVASLHPFFEPQRVAVIGASRESDSIGQRILWNLLDSGFRENLFPIHPEADTLAELKAYPSLEEVPGEIDLAIITVPKEVVSEVVEACGEKGVRSLVIVSAGFGETGEAGRRAQKDLLKKVRGYGMRLVGPNSMGLMNVRTAEQGGTFNASFSGTLPQSGPVAISSQSGALGLALLEHAQTTALGVSSFVSLGNKADVSGNDLLQYWEDDEQTGLIVLYLASFGNPRRFARLARRVGRKKPILAVKAERSMSGTSTDAAVDALFRQTGVVRAQTFEELFDAAAFLSHQPLPKGKRVGVVSNAGGPASLATDALAAAGLEIPETSNAVQEALRSSLLAGSSLTNPIDMSAFATAAHYRHAVETALQGNIDALLVLFSPIGPSHAKEVEQAVGEAVVAARAAGNTQSVLVCFTTYQNARPPLPAGNEHLPTYRFPESAVRALAKAREYAAWCEAPLGSIPDFPDLEVEKARQVSKAVRERGGGWLTPEEVTDILQAFGLTLVPYRLAKNVAEAAQAASNLGYPVVVKLASQTLVDKSDWDGVKLNIGDGDGVRRACEEIETRLRDAGRADDLLGFLVQPMVSEGTELAIGMRQDPLFGPLLSFGLGGVYMEVLHDTVYRITPLTERDAEQMVCEVRGYPLLTGYRGHPPADLSAVQEMLLRVSRLVEELPEIVELDLNPFKAHQPGEGYTILDARIRIGVD